ncbi:MAG: dUTP diphosphatase [Spirochaetales bacterium]|nr:dUTP diphosphatase [Spirochaetales bacterium]
MLTVFCRVQPGAALPTYESEGCAGADLHANTTRSLLVNPGEQVAVPTGLFVEIPAGYEGQVRPRSGLAAKYGITVLNSPGTIDSDYRGEVKVLLINLGKEPHQICDGDRIAQLVIAPVTRATFALKSILSDSRRGEGGFGSTGI